MVYYIGMFKVLRIICSVIAALAVAACVFIFVYAGMTWGIVTLCGAALFFGLTVLFKKLQEAEENKDNPPERKGDFITGPVSRDDDDK